MNLAFKLDDQAATEELVDALAAALAEDDKEEVNRLMYDAQEKIENLPDGMIGLSEMHDYGYLKDDVLPLTKEGAREWHRPGERSRQSMKRLRTIMTECTLAMVQSIRWCDSTVWSAWATFWQILCTIKTTMAAFLTAIRNGQNRLAPRSIMQTA